MIAMGDGAKSRVLRPGALLVAPMMLMASLIALPTPAQAAPGDLTCTANGQSSVTINAGESVTLAASVDATTSLQVTSVFIDHPNVGQVATSGAPAVGSQSVSATVSPTVTTDYFCQGYFQDLDPQSPTTLTPSASVRVVVRPAPSITCEVIPINANNDFYVGDTQVTVVARAKNVDSSYTTEVKSGGSVLASTPGDAAQAVVTLSSPGTQNYECVTTSTSGAQASATASITVQPQPTSVTGAYSLGDIQNQGGAAVRTVSWTAAGAPNGWNLVWIDTGVGSITPPTALPCGTSKALYPELSRPNNFFANGGIAVVRGSFVTAQIDCALPKPTIASALYGNSAVSVNYQVTPGVPAGTQIEAEYQLSNGRKSTTIAGSVAPPQAGTNSNSGSFSVPLSAKKSLTGQVRIRLILGSVKSAWSDASPFDTGKASTPTSTPSTTPTGPTAPTGGTQSSSTTPSSNRGASTGGPGGSSASGIKAVCVAPEGQVYADIHGSVGATLTVAPNNSQLPAGTAFTISSGALPPGIHLDGSAGVISGTPEIAGTWTVGIAASAPDGTVTESSFAVYVDDPHHASNYPDRVRGSRDSAITITPVEVNTHGKTTYRLVCGTLPVGMSLDEQTGVISGTPVASAEMPAPLRVRMTDDYGSVDSSFIFTVEPGQIPWLRYPEYSEIGFGLTSTIVPTSSGMPTVASYAIDGELPPGLAFDPRTGVISGRATVRDNIVYEPTITALDASGAPLNSTWASITVIKPAVPMQVKARAAKRKVNRGKTVVVTKVSHPKYATLNAEVVCQKCTWTFNKKSGRLVVRNPQKKTSVSVSIIASPKGKTARAKYAGHEWFRSWRVK